ncbi:HD domain containing protein [Histomonas meleagridis]|uniref:HD domain containing protein n=1 Tax=Histomonas meleagridis TaxID=135588 RepID=UPI0035595A19|nr:HD domain containing protein [Histomonas meleagridis]KAH0806947.1 HD domain containing protein [Histomonas meleagridis]
MSQEKPTAKRHSPHDEIYGPLFIPSYCWPIIDCPEFQRLRHIRQLGCDYLVYPGATHTRFEHSLGCAHLATLFMEHLQNQQPELKIQPEHAQAVIIAALCHDLGHGPWSHCFEHVAHHYDPLWDHEDMSIKVLKHIFRKYKLDIPVDVIDAAASYIRGDPYEKFPEYLSCIVCNRQCDIDLDKFDYLVRDINRSLNIASFEFSRLIYNCRVVEGKLAWKISEMQTIERLFFNRNNMHNRVYQHHTIQAMDCMITDMLDAADPYFKFEESLQNVELYCKLDDRLFTIIQSGKCGEEAKKIADRICERKLYKLVGELRVNPKNEEGLSYSQSQVQQIEKDISQFADIPSEKLRYVKLRFRYGISKQHPLLGIPFWRSGSEDKIVTLTPSDISSIVPIHFVETAMRVYVTDVEYINVAKKAFKLWKKEKCYQ